MQSKARPSQTPSKAAGGAQKANTPPSRTEARPTGSDKSVKQWAAQMRADAQKFQKDKGKLAPTDRPSTHFRLNPERTDRTPEKPASKSQVQPRRAPSLLGDLMNAGGLTKDIIEQARPMKAPKKGQTIAQEAAALRKQKIKEAKTKASHGKASIVTRRKDRGPDRER